MKSIFKQSIAGLNLIFPSLKLVAMPRLKTSFCFTIYHSCEEKRWIHTFLKGISSKFIDVFEGDHNTLFANNKKKKEKKGQ